LPEQSETNSKTFALNKAFMFGANPTQLQEVGGTFLVDDGLMVMTGAESVDWY
jgi:hypothetical protein